MEQMILVPSFLGELLAVVREDGIRLPRLPEITVGGTAVSPEPVTERPRCWVCRCWRSGG
jgi:hypothetical protein